MRLTRRFALAAAMLVAMGCNNKRVSRIDPNSVTDLSGRWNDVDSRLVANALITQSLSAPWVARHTAATGGAAPAVIVGDFRNKTMEHIAVATFVRDLERAYVQSEAVRVVASRGEREEVRAERTDQQQHAAAPTRASLGMEQGARFMLQGDVLAIEDEEGRERVVYYQIDATLLDLESNEKVWVGQHRIKKYIDRRRIGW